MKPESGSIRLLERTRSVVKAYEFGFGDRIKEHLGHLLPESPDDLLVFAVAALGDAAATTNDGDVDSYFENLEALEFSAKFFDSYLEARLAEDIGLDVAVLASAAYLLASRPGSSLVLIRRAQDLNSNNPIMNLLIWVLRGDWRNAPNETLAGHESIGRFLVQISSVVSEFFMRGTAEPAIEELSSALRKRAYAVADDYDLLLTDLVCACIMVRVRRSSWKQLPALSGKRVSLWRTYLETDSAPRELWPSQIKMGEAGVFSGRSAVVQMPTSAGKTKAVELIIRSALIARRTNAAVIVAPFRALSREIAGSLRESFSDVDVIVNEINDAPQSDFLEGLDNVNPKVFSLVVVTPEKYLYMMRNHPELMPEVGLVIYDEGHQFDSGARGVTYELLLTEIKSLIPVKAQVVLISAVLNNSRALADWLIGRDATVVDGAGIAPTSRVIAFATWLEERGALDFYDVGNIARIAFDVPGIIESSVLGRRERERTDRVFPDKTISGDVALYLALKVAPKGAVAVFCGKKDAAGNVAQRLIEIYERGGSDIEPPSAISDAKELDAIAYLAFKHFGPDAVEGLAARLGVLQHHAGVPEGMRLAAEFAIRTGRAKMVVCTSTLAQGVNLPIRYLIVSSVFQGKSIMRTRDFQNLMGRAGRSGMHTEGTVIFPDVEIYDSRNKDSWKFNRSINLIDPLNSEELGSSLRVLISEVKGLYALVNVTSPEYFSALLERDGSEQWVSEFCNSHRRAGLSREIVEGELSLRRKLLSALQSYLMAQSRDLDGASLKVRAKNLAAGTLAYSTASDPERVALVELFEAVAEDLEERVAEPEVRSVMSRTLLGTGDSVYIRDWVEARVDEISACESQEQLLSLIWPVFQDRSSSQLFELAKPVGILYSLVEKWIEGESYSDLITHGATAHRSWGKQTRKLTKSAIMKFIENSVSYEFVLLLGAVRIFSERGGVHSTVLEKIDVLQKRIKYGVPSQLASSIYEAGYSDRVVAQALEKLLREKGYLEPTFNRGTVNSANIREAMAPFPSFFQAVVYRNK